MLRSERWDEGRGRRDSKQAWEVLDTIFGIENGKGAASQRMWRSPETGNIPKLAPNKDMGLQS